MSPIITNIVYIIINCFTAFIIHRFMNVFFEKSNCKKWQLIATYFLYPLITSTAYLIWGIPLITFLCNILSLSLIAALYQGSVKKKILSVVFIYLFMYVIELIFIAASGINHIHITDRSEQVQLIWHILASIITFLASVLAGGFKNIREHKYSSNMLFVSGIIVPSFSAYLILAIFETGQVKQNTSITSIIFVFAINIIVFYLYDALSLSYEQRIKNELVNQEREFYYNQCEIMHTTSKEIAGLQHDMKNHFFALHELIDDGEYSKAKDYILELTEKSSGQAIICDTGNIVIDSIINYKFRNKDSLGIAVSVDAVIPEQINIDVADEVTIFGNLIDNVITAVEKCESDRKVSINLQFSKNRLFIVISNTYDGRVEYTNGTIVSTKEEKDLHGFGIKNVRSALEKYNGVLRLEHNETEFTARAILYLNDSQ